MVEVVATHFAITNGNFSCHVCKEKYPEPRRKTMKGCSDPINNPVAKYKDKIVFYKCPSNFYSAYVAEVMSHARHLENGLLPYSGGLFDQPAKLVELMGLLNSLRIEDELTRLKKQSEEAKRWQKTRSSLR